MNLAEARDKCALCLSNEDNELDLGDKIKRDNLTAHYYCLLLSSGLIQNGDDDDGLMGFLEEDIKTESNRVRPFKCYLCKKPSANIGCCKTKCRRTFHTICGIKNDCLSVMCDTFPSYCTKHLPQERKNYRHTAKEICGICLDAMGKFNPIQSVSPICCSKWFHLTCLKKVALNAGYFCRCPLCNNEDIFRQDVIRRGVFIPDRDASWETEPNAFVELLERTTLCEALNCVCPNGREFENGIYELTYCNSCGSACVHDCCWTEDYPFVCNDCKVVPSIMDSVVRIQEELQHERRQSDETDDVDIVTTTTTTTTTITITTTLTAEVTTIDTPAATSSDVTVRIDDLYRRPTTDTLNTTAKTTTTSDTESEIAIKTNKGVSRNLIPDDSDSELSSEWDIPLAKQFGKTLIKKPDTVAADRCRTDEPIISGSSEYRNQDNSNAGHSNAMKQHRKTLNETTPWDNLISSASSSASSSSDDENDNAGAAVRRTQSSRGKSKMHRNRRTKRKRLSSSDFDPEFKQEVGQKQKLAKQSVFDHDSNLSSEDDDLITPLKQKPLQIQTRARKQRIPTSDTTTTTTTTAAQRERRRRIEPKKYVFTSSSDESDPFISQKSSDSGFGQKKSIRSRRNNAFRKLDKANQIIKKTKTVDNDDDDDDENDGSTKCNKSKNQSSSEQSINRHHLVQLTLNSYFSKS